MATDKYYSPDNYVKCFNYNVLEELINKATKDPDAGEKMLEWFKEKRANLITNYNKVQAFFKQVLDCENVDRELKFDSEDANPAQIRQIAFGLKHILCQVRGEIKELLFTPNLKINEEDMKKIAPRKGAKKRKGNPDNLEKFLKKARLDGEQIDKTDGQKSATQNRVLRELLSLDKQRANLTNEKAELTTCITELGGTYSGLMVDISASNKERAEVEKILVDKKAELKELKDKIKEEEAQLENVKGETESTKNSLDKVKSEMANVEKMMTDKEAELVKLKDKIKEEEAHLENVKGETESAKDSLDKVNNERADVEKKLIDKRNELTELSNYLEEREKFLEDVKVSITESEEQERNLRRGINDQFEEFKTKSAKLSALFKKELANTMNTLDRKTLLTKMQLKDDHSSEFNSKKKGRVITQKRKRRIKTQARGVESLLDSSSDDHDKLVIDE